MDVPPSPLTQQLAHADSTVQALADRLASLQQSKAQRLARHHARRRRRAADAGADGGGGDGGLNVEASHASLTSLESSSYASTSGGGHHDEPRCCRQRTHAAPQQDQGNDRNVEEDVTINGVVGSRDLADRTGGVAAGDCSCLREIEELEVELGLAGEVGQALLNRYELLQAKHEDMLSLRGARTSHTQAPSPSASTPSADELSRLERSLENSHNRFRDVLRANEQLESRLGELETAAATSAAESRSLRAELARERAQASKRWSSSSRAEAEADERHEELVRALADTRELADHQERRLRDEVRRRQRAEERLAEVEAEIGTRAAERAKGSGSGGGGDEGDVQRAMADLVADNALLRHARDDLQLRLDASEEAVSLLHQDVDALRRGLPRTPIEGDDVDPAAGIRNSIVSTDSSGSSSAAAAAAARRQRPLSLVLSTAATSHNRQYSLTQSLAGSVASSTHRQARQHARRTSTTPSVASSHHDPMRSPVVARSTPGGAGAESDGALSPGPGISPRFGVTFRRPSPSLSGGAFAQRSSTEPPWPGRRPAANRAFSGVEEVIAETEDARATSPFGTEDTSVSGNSARKQTAFTSPEPGLGRSNTVKRRQLMLLSRAEPPSDAAGDSSKPSLGGLGLEPSSHPASPRSGPLAAPFSPGQHSENSQGSHHDDRTAYLLLLLDHASKLLVRLRQADVPTLSKRLKKQHLPGDVSHLSASTLKTLGAEITDMRESFRQLLEEERKANHAGGPSAQESAVTRKDFALLLRLFKEMLVDLLDMRTKLNQVVLEPSSAKRLREAALAEAQEESNKQGALPKAVANLGWIAAPITKFWGATVPVETSTAPTTTTALRAPKLLPSASATTTHVNVEFGGTGAVKRAKQNSPFEELPDSPALARVATVKRVPIQGRSRPSITLGDGTVRGPVAGRQSLYGIFAGASALPSVQTSSTGPSRLRHASSQATLTAGPRSSPRQTSLSHRRQTSTVVDAIIDQAIPEHHLEEVFEEGDQSPARGMERSFRRPRGLSDSSIRSAFRPPHMMVA